MDVVISNCVINLCSDKEAVFREIWRVLRPGGELYFSDMFADRRVPLAAKADKMLWGEGLAGALYRKDFARTMAAVGFAAYWVVRLGVFPSCNCGTPSSLVREQCIFTMAPGA